MCANYTFCSTEWVLGHFFVPICRVYIALFLVLPGIDDDEDYLAISDEQRDGDAENCRLDGKLP